MRLTTCLHLLLRLRMLEL